MAPNALRLDERTYRLCEREIGTNRLSLPVPTLPWQRVPRSDELVAHRQRCRLTPVAGSQLAQDPGDVTFNGTRAQK